MAKIEIIMAIYVNNLTKVKELVNKDNVNEVDEHNYTALHWACVYNQLDIVKYLLSIGADLSLKNSNYRTPLDLAIINNSIDVKDFLQFYIRFNK